MNKECLHNWETGWQGDFIIFCTKCNKDLDVVYGSYELYRTHTAKNGYLVPKDDAPPVEPKPAKRKGWFRRLWDEITAPDDNFQF
jgi:hypothetical protein